MIGSILIYFPIYKELFYFYELLMFLITNAFYIILIQIVMILLKIE